MVYCSGSLALAALEVLVHGSPEELAGEFQAVSATLPRGTSLEVVTPEDLPPGWRAHPPPPEITHFGSRWAVERRSAALVVPSAVVPVEWNLLLAPQVGKGAVVGEVERHPFSFDPRLWEPR